MTQTYVQPFSTDFSTVSNMQANGQIVAGNTQPAGIGTQISIVNGAYRAQMNSTDTPTATGIRSEVTFAPTALNNENWYPFEMLINKADWDNGVNDAAFITVWQIHPADALGAIADPIALAVYNDILWVCTPQTTPPSTGSNFNLFPVMPFEFGRWNKIVVHAIFSTTVSGLLEVIVNNRKVFNLNPRIGTDYTADVPYPKYGVYDAAHLNNFGPSRTAYYRNASIWQGAGDGYEQVMGAGLVPVPSPIVIL